MQTLDYVVLGGYFFVLIVIGLICSRFIKKQEDFFMGGRGFGKLLQTFAAFGAGTGAHDPINLGRTTWTSGLSGIWAALNWLFVTPFYWIFAVWYRRMRHLTLGDWFVERYESKAMGAAYTVFAFTFQICYLSIMFSAISKIAQPLLGEESVLALVSLIGSNNPEDLKWVMVPMIGAVVIVYGVIGGLTAAYWTDLLQGLGIILLSVILIPAGLNLLVQKYGDDYVAHKYGAQAGEQAEAAAAELNTMDGFEIMHWRVTDDYFQLLDTPRAGEFPIHFIVAFTILSLVGIVVQPHFIATGGGSAKTEFNARMGLVTGNFLKRLCTIGWALTGLIALALFANNVSAAEDPDRVWGIASREILGPFNMGLVGLMLACLLAALMSSADCYMLVSSALIVRNVYAAYFDPDASERTYVNIGRLASLLIIFGAAALAISTYDVFAQYQMALEVCMFFAAPFWIGMFWRRATTSAAWMTVAFSLLVFVIIPMTAPLAFPQLRENQTFALTNDIVTTTTTRKATVADVDKRNAEIELWEQTEQELKQALANYLAAEQSLAGNVSADYSAIPATGRFAVLENRLQKLVAAKRAFDKMGPKPKPIKAGEDFKDTFKSGGTAIFWTGGVKPTDQFLFSADVAYASQLDNGASPAGMRDVFSKNGVELPASESITTVSSGSRWQVTGEQGKTYSLRKVDDRLDVYVASATSTKQISDKKEGNSQIVTERYEGHMRGEGWFNLEYLLYHVVGQWIGWDLRTADNAMLQTLRLPPRIITPFLVMILLSLITPRNSQHALDRFYVKMKTPVKPDRHEDEAELEESYRKPQRHDNKRLIPWFGLEIQRPKVSDVVGFVVSFIICFIFIGLAIWLAGIGK